MTGRTTTSAIDGLSVPDTRKCLYEIRQKWRTVNHNQGFYFSDQLQSVPAAMRPLTIERFAFLFIAGQAQKRETRPPRD